MSTYYTEDAISSCNTSVRDSCSRSAIAAWGDLERSVASDPSFGSMCLIRDEQIYDEHLEAKIRNQADDFATLDVFEDQLLKSMKPVVISHLKLGSATCKLGWLSNEQQSEEMKRSRHLIAGAIGDRIHMLQHRSFVVHQVIYGYAIDIASPMETVHVFLVAVFRLTGTLNLPISGTTWTCQILKWYPTLAAPVEFA